MTFEQKLQSLINTYSIENQSNTPDFILVQYIRNCLDAFASATRQRDTWFSFIPFENSILKDEVPPLQEMQIE